MSLYYGSGPQTNARVLSQDHCNFFFVETDTSVRVSGPESQSHGGYIKFELSELTDASEHGAQQHTHPQLPSY